MIHPLKFLKKDITKFYTETAKSPIQNALLLLTNLWCQKIYSRLCTAAPKSLKS